MSELVAQVLVQAVAPVGVNHEVFGAAEPARLSDEVGTASGEFRMLGLHELFVAFLVFEEIDENFRARRGQMEIAIDLLAQVGQILEHEMIAAHFDVGQEDELRDAQGVFARRSGDRLFIGTIVLRPLVCREQVAAGDHHCASGDDGEPKVTLGSLHAFHPLILIWRRASF